MELLVTTNRCAPPAEPAQTTTKHGAILICQMLHLDMPVLIDSDTVVLLFGAAPGRRQLGRLLIP